MYKDVSGKIYPNGYFIVLFLQKMKNSIPIKGASPRFNQNAALQNLEKRKTSRIKFSIITTTQRVIIQAKLIKVAIFLLLAILNTLFYHDCVKNQTWYYVKPGTTLWTDIKIGQEV